MRAAGCASRGAIGEPFPVAAFTPTAKRSAKKFGPDHVEAFRRGEGNCRDAARDVLYEEEPRGRKNKIPSARNFLPVFWVIYAPSDWTGGEPAITASRPIRWQGTSMS